MTNVHQLLMVSLGIDSVVRCWALSLFAVLAPAVCGQSVKAHLRVQPKNGVEWGWRDSQGRALTVSMPSVVVDDWWDRPDIFVHYGDAEPLHLQWDAANSLKEVSLIADISPECVRLRLSHSTDAITVDLPPVIAPEPALEAIVSKAKTVRNDLKYTPAPKPVFVTRFADVEALRKYIKSSNDPNEGLWTFYDHRVAQLRARLGGEYSLATVRNGDGYDIIYLAGADIDDTLPWQPLEVKGRLNMTPVSGVFNLDWVTATRTPVSYYSSASVADNVLTLQFHYWKSTMRFVRNEADL